MLNASAYSPSALTNYADLRPAAARISWRWGLISVLVVWTLFGVAHGTLRLTGSDVLSRADALEVVATQSLQIGYQVGQPPLFDWLLWAVQSAFGASLASVLLVKYLLLVAAGVSLYLGAKVVTASERLAGLAAFTPFLLFNVTASMHELSTHSVALVAALAFTFYGFVMVGERGAGRDYVALGLAAGLGILSKHGYPICFVAIVLAFLLAPKTRRRILAPRFGITIVVMLLLAGPFIVWLMLHLHEIDSSFSSALTSGSAPGIFERVAHGEIQLIASVSIYLLPAMLVIPLVFWRHLSLLPSWGDAQKGNVGEIIAIGTIIAFFLTGLTIAFLGIDIVRSRYAHVIAFLMPVVLVMRLNDRKLTQQSVTVLLALTFLFQVGILLARAGELAYATPPFCKNCALGTPYNVLADRLKLMSLDDGTIVVSDRQVGGNLRVRLTSARIKVHAMPERLAADLTPPAATCAFVWEAQTAKLPVEAWFGHGERPKPEAIERLKVRWLPRVLQPRRWSSWTIVRLSKDHPLCR